MSFSTGLNKEVVKFNANTEGYPYQNLKDFEVGKVFTLNCIYINKKSKYGDAPVVGVTEGFFINLPAHQLADAQMILNDPEKCKDINEGRAGIKVCTYETNGQTYYKAAWVDVLPN